VTKYRPLTGQGLMPSQAVSSGFSETTNWNINTVTDITIILVTLPTFMFEYFVSVWTLRWSNLRSDVIETGVVQGLPLSTEARWVKLFHEWAPLLASQCAFLVIVALGWISLAGELSHPSVKALVYAYAFLSGVASLGFAVFGTQNLVRMISMLRQAEADGRTTPEA